MDINRISLDFAERAFALAVLADKIAEDRQPIDALKVLGIIGSFQKTLTQAQEAFIYLEDRLEAANDLEY